MENNQSIVLSGMQPTNQLHIGNYFGAITQWLELQKYHKCFFLIVDLHSLTTILHNKDITNIYENSIEVLATYLACGLEIDKNTKIALQSQLPHHTYFQWILSCITSIGDLNRMVQMKDKSKQYGDYAGIFTYPILMASDILLYNPNYVPVGEDQTQHLELARTLAKRLNNILDQEYFNIPDNLNIKKTLNLKNNFNRVRDLIDSSKKMSKSHSKGCLFLRDTDDIIIEKIMKAQTDSYPLPNSLEELYINDENKTPRNAIINLFEIYSGFTGENMDTITKKFANSMTSSFKKELSAAAIEFITPIRRKINDLLKNKHELETILQSNKQDFEKYSSKNLKIICEKILGQYNL